MAVRLSRVNFRVTESGNRREPTSSCGLLWVSVGCRSSFCIICIIFLNLMVLMRVNMRNRGCTQGFSKGLIQVSNFTGKI